MKRNFTLIEILGVTFLISILAAIGVAGYMYAVESSKESATKATIERLRAGFTALNDDGLMLVTKKGSDTAFVAVTFNPDPGASGDKLKFGDSVYDSSDYDTGDVEKAYKVFAGGIDAESIKKGTHVNAKNQIIDGWGNPIMIRFPGKFNKGGIDIISAGSDGKFGEDESDTVPEDIDKFRDSKGNWICDDIANF